MTTNPLFPEKDPSGSGNPQKDTRRGLNYIETIKRVNGQINWLFLTILLFAGINFSMLYVWHFGNIEDASKGNSTDLEEVDEMYSKMEKSGVPSQIMSIKIISSTSDSAKHIRRVVFSDTLNVNDTCYISIDCPASQDLSYLRKLALRKYLNKRQISLDAMKSNGMFSTIPFFGLTLFNGDYLIVLLIIGQIFMFWLLVNIKNTRDTLKEYINAPSILDYSDNEAISSLFSFIMPNLDNFRRYRFFEIGLLIYIFSLIFILISNIYDVWIKTDFFTGLTLAQRPGFENYFGFVISATLITSGGVILSSWLLWVASKYLLDIRNIVIILKWFNGSLKPAVLASLKKHSREIYKGMKPHYEYKRVDSSSDLHFCISIFYTKSNLPTSGLSREDDFEFKTIKGKINLPRSLRLYNKNRREWSTKEVDHHIRVSIDPDLQRRLTDEELRMKNFFELLLLDRRYGGELARDWESL